MGFSRFALQHRTESFVGLWFRYSRAVLLPAGFTWLFQLFYPQSGILYWFTVYHYDPHDSKGRMTYAIVLAVKDQGTHSGPWMGL